MNSGVFFCHTMTCLLRYETLNSSTHCYIAGMPGRRRRADLLIDVKATPPSDARFDFQVNGQALLSDCQPDQGTAYC
jgi:hypothetical protein